MTSSGRFHSILFDRPDGGVGRVVEDEPTCFPDLNLDQVVASVTAGREEYDLAPFFYTQLHDVAEVHYRHEVLRDLENHAVAEAITSFAQQMRRRRELIALSGKLHYRLQQQRLFLDAVETNCLALRSLADELAKLPLTSRGLTNFRAYLTEYVASEAFASLENGTKELRESLAGVRYSVHIKGSHVRVDRYHEQPDYAAEVEATFAKFKQGAVADHRAEIPNYLEMNHVEAKILGLVAQLFPDVFGALEDFVVRHGKHLDPTIAAFDREVQFYLAYLELVDRLAQAGLPFCYAEVIDRPDAIDAHDAFDLALAIALGRDGASAVVRNDVVLNGPERIIVVTGPNQGGKTTFARMVGEFHYLASLGLPVPAGSARLFLPDRVFTHFEREEELANLKGKLEDDLSRIHDILATATAESVIIMNESFTSTTLEDARDVGSAVMNQIVELGAVCVCVTFVDELASLAPSIVSMVGTILPEDPTVRTYRILRKPADGLAYAAAIADKYGLTYESLRRRIPR